MMDEITELFAAIVEYAEALDVRDINKLPGCWEFSPGPGWWLAMNGHKEPKKCSHGAEVPAYHAYVEWNGFPAGLIGPGDGTLAAGTQANEEALLRALRSHGAGTNSAPETKGKGG